MGKFPDDTPCYLCGQRQADQHEHVFPRLLFPKGGSFSNLPPRQPSCSSCNNALSKDEELFQQLVMSWRTLDTPVGRQVYMTKVRPNLRGKRPHIRARVLGLTEFVPMVKQDGTQIGTWPVMSVPRSAVNNVLGKMVKGLYYMETRQVMPVNAEIIVEYAGQDTSQLDRLLIPEIMSSVPKQVVGSEDILAYWRAVEPSDPLISITWFVFYRWHAFRVVVRPPDSGH